MKIQLTQQEAEAIMNNALCDSGIGMHGLEFTFDKHEYHSSQVRWMKANEGISPCYEDVLMQMLRDGYSIGVIDTEGDDGEYDKTITMQDVYDRMNLVHYSRIIQMVEEDYDADTTDVVLQTIFYGEVIFG
jgi:hypothetical protein